MQAILGCGAVLVGVLCIRFSRWAGKTAARNTGVFYSRQSSARREDTATFLYRFQGCLFTVVGTFVLVREAAKLF